MSRAMQTPGMPSCSTNRTPRRSSARRKASSVARPARNLPGMPSGFSYDVLPANHQSAIDLIHQEVEAARKEGRNAGLLVPLTRGQGGGALQFEVEPASLDRLER